VVPPEGVGAVRGLSLDLHLALGAPPTPRLGDQREADLGDASLNSTKVYLGLDAGTSSG
jgi:hypothetical protein